MGTIIANVTFGVSAAVAGSGQLLYADWMSQDVASPLMLHLTLVIALGMTIGAVRPDIERFFVRLGRWMRGRREGEK